MEISVVIPVFNEVGSIRALLLECCTALRDRLEFEIVVVDDGSSDGTPEALQSCRASIPQLRVLRHVRRCGQSAAIASGIQAARAQCIATLDGDGQNDPADILLLYEALQGSDGTARLVTGHRLKRRDGFVRRLSSRVANGVRSGVLRDGVPDTGCGLKLFARATWLQLPHFDHMHRFLPALVVQQGGSVVSLPVNHRDRRSGHSKYGIGNRLWVGFVDMFGVWWLGRRRMRPEVREVGK